MFRITKVAAFGAALIALPVASPAVAQDYPAKPVKLLVAFAPGGSWSGTLRGVDGSEPVTLAPGTGCCARVAADVRLAPGASLRLELSTGDGAFPAIDQIVIDSIIS